MMPGFVTAALVNVARRIVSAKHPEINYDLVSLTAIKEGRVVQMLHVGPYDKEQPTIDAMHAHMRERGLVVSGRHHEIYLSDPRRTAPAKLRTIIRYPVKPARR
jgi:hypothetical protein